MDKNYEVKSNSDKLALIKFAEYGVSVLRDKDINDDTIVKFLKSNFDFSDELIDQII
jgi:hypothetical protein